MIDFLGLIGLVLLLLAFSLLETGQLKVRSWEYLLMNFFGAGLLAEYAWSKQAYIFVVLEVFWAGVSGYELRFVGEKKPTGKKAGAKKS